MWFHWNSLLQQMILIIKLNDNSTCNWKALSNVKNIFIAECVFKTKKSVMFDRFFQRMCNIPRTLDLTVCSVHMDSFLKLSSRSNSHFSPSYWRTFFVFLLTSFKMISKRKWHLDEISYAVWLQIFSICWAAILSAKQLNDKALSKSLGKTFLRPHHTYL